MKRTAILIFILASTLAAQAEPLKGVVRNGTTNKPSVGDEVTLKRIGNGMEDAGKTKTNARGEFSFNVPPAQQPYIVWIQHQGVIYTQRAMPGGNDIVARVFDASPEVKEINIIEHAVVLHTGDAANTLIAEDIYTVGNTSNPPRTMLKPHTLEFALPEGASITESSARSAGGMEVKAAVVPQGEPNKYAFGFPVRPGETQFDVKYTVAYPGKLKMNPASATPVDTLVIAIPQSIKFSASDSSQYQSRNNPQFPGVNLLVAKNVAANSNVGFEIKGSGDMPRESGAAGGGQPENNRPGGGLGLPNQMPDPLQSGQWLFLGVLSLFLAAGAIYVYTANQHAPAAANPQNRGGMLMEALKEEVFQLEADRLQGKVSQQDYQTAKSALDKTLQRAVQRQSAGK